MKKIIFALLATLPVVTLAADTPPPYLPPEEIVARVLYTHPAVQAAKGMLRVEEANRDRLEAGPHEWNLRLASQQRRARPNALPQERYAEWNAALERPLRLPGKAALDAELGAAGVAIAESVQGDALHETSRELLKAWFVWLRENAAASQWTAQVALLEKQAQAVQRRQQLGDAARLEGIQAEAALAQARAQFHQARARQQIAGEDLRRRFPGLPLSEPREFPAPPALEAPAEHWIEDILRHSHELALASGESRRTRLQASRQEQDRLPDPSLGLQFSRERDGEEHVVGAYISIPLPGGGRRAAAEAARAQAGVSERRNEAVRQKVAAEAAALYHAAQAGQSSWQAAHQAAEQLGLSARLTQRAYALGEGSLGELLASQRLANEARLNARLSQLDALELHSRLLLDAHRLWELD